jgi:hypothetical protein
MISKIFAGLLLALTLGLGAGPAAARTSVAIVNHPDVPVVTGSGKTLPPEAVRQAIVLAGANKGWTIVPQGDGKLQASIKVRNKHTVIVLIAYNPQKYSLTYQDSIDMNYGQRNNEPVIHPFYNTWVGDLKEAIRLELIKA